MNRILVIADDLSGAAEIAGLAHRFGLPTRMLRSRTTDIRPGVTVFDTDSRHLSADDAVRAVRLVLRDLRTCRFDLIYKKTDSVFRGNLHAETDAASEFLGRATALLLPQNPSRGRTIAGGEYLIGGVPLRETEFAHDPDHPARSSSARDLLAGDADCLDADDPRPLPEVAIANAQSQADVDRWARRVDEHVLPAGSSDFFEAILRARGLQSTKPFIAGPLRGKSLLIRGTTANVDQLERLQRDNKLVVCPAQSADVLDALRNRPTVAATAPTARQPGESKHIESDLAAVAHTVLAQTRIDTLLVEGGATAAAVAVRMGWTDFSVEGEYATGVVAMTANNQRLIIKPGSYPWPESLWG